MNMFIATFGTSLALKVSYFQKKSTDKELLTVHTGHYLYKSDKYIWQTQEM